MLSNKLLQGELFDKGFVRLNKINDHTLKQLKSFYIESNPPESSDDFFTSTLSLDLSYRKKVNEGLGTILTNTVEDVFTNCKKVNANFMVKPPESMSSICELHQDWSYVDENHFTAFNIWIPLTDTNSCNGAIHFIPGSHKFDNRIRGRNIWWPYYDIQKFLIDMYAEPVYLSAGEPVVFIGKTFHYSPANLTELPRVAASMVVVSKEAQLYSYYQRNESIYRAKVTEDFFTEHGVYSASFEKNLHPELLTDANTYRKVFNEQIFKNVGVDINS